MCNTFAILPGGLDLPTYLAADYAIDAGSVSRTFEQWALDEFGSTRRIRIMVPQFAIRPECVAATDTRVTTPSFVAEKAATVYPLKAWPVPFAMPKMQTSLYWSNVLHHNPSQLGLRQLIERA